MTTAATTPGAVERSSTPLRPAITRPMLTVFVIGDVLGAGIYALVGEVAGKVGGAIWTSFLAAGILAAFTATAYAELVTKYPQAAGAALYTHKAYRRPFFTFLVAFAVMCSGVASAATLATAFGGDYLAEFVELPKLLVGAAFIGLLALINFRGIKESVSLNLGLTSIELTGLLLVTVIGLTFLFDGGGDPGRALEFTSDEAVPLAILSGASLAFFALIGFEDSVNVAEETREPSRVFPPALFTGLMIALAIYIVVTLIAGMAVPVDTLSESDGPLLEVVQLGPLAMNTKVFSAIALFALTNGDTTVLLLLGVFVCVNVAVLVLRRERVEHDHWHAPTALPVLGALACLGLIVQKAFDDASVFAYAGGLLALGLVLWAVSRAIAGPPEPVDPAALVD